MTSTDNKVISSSCGYLKQVNKKKITGSFDSMFSFTTGEVQHMNRLHVLGLMSKIHLRKKLNSHI